VFLSNFEFKGKTIANNDLNEVRGEEYEKTYSSMLVHIQSIMASERLPLRR